jgi:hypothetical protein
LSNEYLNFAEISEKVSFIDLFNFLNIPYSQKNDELKTQDGIIVNVKKNLYFNTKDENQKGSVINFLAHFKQIDLREAASILKSQFLSDVKEIKPKRDIPQLILEWDSYFEERGITLEIAKEYEIGFVKQRSVIAGRIAFKIYDHDSKLSGYVGYKKDDESWFFPKGFKRPLYNAFRLTEKKSVIVTTDPFDALRIVSMGFKQVVSLLANSMTTEQEEQLIKFQNILLFHKEAGNIVNRLCLTSFIKAPVLSKPLKELTNKELINLIKPSS